MSRDELKNMMDRYVTPAQMRILKMIQDVVDDDLGNDDEISGDSAKIINALATGFDERQYDEVGDLMLLASLVTAVDDSQFNDEDLQDIEDWQASQENQGIKERTNA